MRKYLQVLKPTDIEDLIAMNALYRPGPMEFIPNFIDRKHGKEAVEFPHELLEPILKNTYGIMVYQEQIMQTAQIMAGYSLGQADLLRRAMGKKKIEEMNKQRAIFIEGAKSLHNISKEKANEIFDIMERFAAYGFNRSHSAAYSVVAYQTAYIKSHYPSEYMASVLTHNQNNIDKITFFMDECKRQQIKVLGPHVNESDLHFDVNQEGQIRFGLGAIKGTGEAAVDAIISERDESGFFKDIFDFAQRVSLRTVNKKTFESLAMAGAFDSFDSYHRRQYLVAENGDTSLIEKLIRFGNRYQEEQNASQVSLFGGDSGVDIPLPKIPESEPYSELEKLKIEKEVVGFYISGHPLDQFRLDIKHFCTCAVNNIENHKGEKIAVAGIVTKFIERISKKGRPFGLFSIEDFEDSLDLAMFGEEYLKYRHLLSLGSFIYIDGQVLERYNQPGVWELRPFNIQLLSEIRDKLSKGIQIQVDLHQLTDELIDKLESITTSYPGPCQLKLSLGDQQENIEVETLSRKFKVKPENEMIKELEELTDISFKILN